MSNTQTQFLVDQAEKQRLDLNKTLELLQGRGVVVEDDTYEVKSIGQPDKLVLQFSFSEKLNPAYPAARVLCTNGAPGWRCTRDLGHQGPCAAVRAWSR